MYHIEIIAKAEHYGIRAKGKKKDSIGYLDNFEHSSQVLYRTFDIDNAKTFKDYKEAAREFFAVVGYYRYFECMYEIRLVFSLTDRVDLVTLTEDEDGWEHRRKYKFEKHLIKSKEAGRVAHGNI